MLLHFNQGRGIIADFNNLVESKMSVASAFSVIVVNLVSDLEQIANRILSTETEF